MVVTNLTVILLFASSDVGLSACMDVCVQKLVVRNAQAVVSLARGNVHIINAIGNVLKYVTEFHAISDAKYFLDAGKYLVI